MSEADALTPHATEPSLVKWRRVSYGASCVCCLLSGSFTVFSLYTEHFENKLGYSPLEINYVSIAAEMGLYLCVPALGYIADAFRLSYIGLIGCATYLVGYAGCSWVAATGRSWPWMAFFFAIVGIACSAGFIASFVNCARIFSNSGLLAISVPTTLYGCSSLLYARLISRCLNSGFSLSSVYLTLGAVLSVVGIVVALAPVWAQTDKIAAIGEPSASEEIPADARESARTFFNDWRALIFLGSFVLVSGPLEMYQNNLGIIVMRRPTGTTEEIAYQVALFTGFSTFIRLFVGAVTDFFHIRPPLLLLGVLGILLLADASFAKRWLSLGVLSAISGIGYGSSFTLYPLIVSHIWGIEGFATHWGMFILGPAIGSFLFGVIFAMNVQRSADYTGTFWLCSAVLVVSCALIYRLRLHLAY